jgi:hypothetical protein
MLYYSQPTSPATGGVVFDFSLKPLPQFGDDKGVGHGHDDQRYEQEDHVQEDVEHALAGEGGPVLAALVSAGWNTNSAIVTHMSTRCNTNSVIVTQIPAGCIKNNTMTKQVS